MKNYLFSFFLVFAGKNTGDKTLKWVADFAAKVEDSVEIKFFQWCDSHYLQLNRYVYLMHPTRKLISINEPIEFKIYVKGAINVCLIDEFYNLKSLTRISGEKDIWFSEYSNRIKGELKLSAKFENEGHYYTLFSYFFL